MLTHERLTVDVHDRDDRSSNFSDEDLEQSRGEGTHRSGEGEYMQERSPPNRNSAGRQRERFELTRQGGSVLIMHLLSPR